MAEDYELRAYLLEHILRTPYGEFCFVDERDAWRAWPPTGIHNRSMAGMFMAIALAYGGHRPETDLTTEDRISRDLGPEFDFEHVSWDAKYVFRRRVEFCPHCKGLGEYRRLKPFSLREGCWKQAEVPPIEKMESIYEIVRCEHPLKNSG